MIFVITIICSIGFLCLAYLPVQAGVANQIPTGTVPTVTGTPTGPIVTVKLDIDQPQINVRSGPGTTYDKVGVLLLGQKAVAKGRTRGGDWILIDYPGVAGSVAWINSALVNITPGELPVVDPPPTPTPLVTITIDPTMAAQFVVTMAPTRLPTFTPPPQLMIPTFTAEQTNDAPAGVPMGIVILGLAAVGIILGLFSLAQGR
ncbi:MAG TPA: SH3 domain-containing protein [Anaerolineaceae bacterium]|nr:SH3 domain-containing protein [Anaerolineaceae bacterium]